MQGLALAQVNTQILKLKTIGLPELATGMPGDESVNWEQLTNYWRIILEKLAADFTSGQAQVDPVNAQVCTTCAFGLICRKSNI
jgi:hypothetical protein